MKILNILFLSLFMFKTDASCQSAYKKFRRQALSAPITAPTLSSTRSTQGAVSTTEGSLRADFGATTAGSVNGLGFTYEGSFYLEMMSSNFRHFKGRSKVLSILEQAEVGVGEELGELLDELSESSSEGMVFLEDLVSVIQKANEKKVFCPKNKELFTYKNMWTYLFYQLNL